MGSIVNSVADIFGVGPASQQAKGVESAAAASQAGTNRSLDLQREMFYKQLELQEPFRAAGVNAINRLGAGLAAGGEFATPFSKTNFTADPGYAFRLSEGNKALNASAAARGGLISGNALRAAQSYGQELGSQEYQNAFNRYYAERTNMLNPIQSLAGTGQTTSNALAGMAGNYGQNASNTIMQGSANRANSELQLGNIRGSQYGNYGNAIGQIGSMFGGDMFGGGGAASYSGPSYGTNSSFDNSWFNSNSYD
jgi:hypothetical protein